MRTWARRVVALLLLWSAGFPVPEARGENKLHQELNVPRKERPRESLLEMIFGSPPPMPTKSGKVILEAFHDLDGNGRRDPGEVLLDQEIRCEIDQVEYTLPAFVPGLAIETVFPLNCRGEAFIPASAPEDIFFKVPGEIITLSIPSRRKPPSPSP